MHNILGQVVFGYKGKGKGNFVYHKVYDLPSGVYFAQITQSGRRATDRFIILK